MARVIIAFANAALRTRVAEALERGGFPPSHIASSGAEVKRAVGKLGGGVIVCGFKLADTTADELSVDLSDRAVVLVVAPPADLEHCEHGAFKLPAPVNAGDLTGAVNMLCQLDDRRISHPKRTESENVLVLRAKQLLMDKNRLSEQEAHRFLQKISMDTGCKMAESAAYILEMNGGTVE